MWLLLAVVTSATMLGALALVSLPDWVEEDLSGLPIVGSLAIVMLTPKRRSRLSRKTRSLGTKH